VPRHIAQLVSRIIAWLVVTTSPTPRVWVPRHVARLIPIVDYFDNAARLGASTRRAAHRPSLTTSTTPHVLVSGHVAQLVTRLVTPLVVDYSALRRLVVDYFASAARPGASAHRAARHTARRAARHRLL
jgi:hypothetical protein